MHSNSPKNFRKPVARTHRTDEWPRKFKKTGQGTLLLQETSHHLIYHHQILPTQSRLPHQEDHHIDWSVTVPLRGKNFT